MMNGEWKDQFVADTGFDYAIKYFSLISDREDMLKKDLSVFTVDEIIAFYKSLCSSSYMFLTNCNYSFILYTRNCLSKSLVPDGQNHYEEITSDTIKSCLDYNAMETRIISYEELIRQEDSLENVYDACLVHAVFEGILGKGYSELSALHVDQLDGKRLHLENRTITVSKRLIGLMTASSETFEGVSLSTSDTKHRKNSFRADDDRVFKENNKSRIETEERRRIRIYRRMFKIQEYMGNSKAFTFTNLRRSGLIYNIKCYMKKNNISAYDAIIKYRSEIENQYSRIPSVKQFVSVYEPFLQE